MTAVSCRDLTKWFGRVRALEGVNLDVDDGEVVALLGPSGCGKTTFLRLVAGFERPNGGTVTLHGRVVAGDGAFVPPERRGVGFVFQDYALFPHLTVARNVAFGLARAGRAARLDEVLELVGLRAESDRYPHELSGGQQQRVALARALAPQPRLVLLDEPFASLDADLRARVRSEVGAILRAAGATAIFVTHDQEEAFEVADRVAVMRAGRVDQIGRPEEIYHTPDTRAVADFVGEAAFLAATVDGARLVTELGTFPLGAIDLEPGPAELMIRPEDVELTADPAAPHEVVARTFRGPVSITWVRLASGLVIASAHSSQQVFGPGDRARALLRPDHLVVFRGDRRIASVAARAHTGTDESAR